MAAIQISATAKNVPMSPRKVRRVAATVQGKMVAEALALLRLLPQKAAGAIAKVVKSASANAENNFNLNPAELRVDRVVADCGPTRRLYRPRARGRAGIIKKRSSHIVVVVREAEG